MDKKIRIFDGVDGVGKTTSLLWLKKYYENKGNNVVVLHEKNRKQLLPYKYFIQNRTTIKDYHEKQILSLDSYSYFIQILFEQGVDVILIDRMFLTQKFYADINRPKSIERVFGSSETFIKYINVFEKQLLRITDDVELYCFVKEINSKFVDDTDDVRWTQQAQKLECINKLFATDYNKITKHIKSVKFTCTDVGGYYDAKEQLINYITN
ncbi:hypothetical protein HYO65_gp259 [Tenacibaculum phage PTm1]|uniref:Uncharacterized protein n=2 Tax=Shirahamavirus PTm1 TaxID=2846435 RepID=A0A5S9BZ63_9CAUD|nr:hypothetical protein HYO65_gp259 [Tenacibaculum phage PTm1]BBI90651.1 hypothetical protein [Tenacibaculum phage PTm1]BBI90956.1 hypothetical protein [Tenacibaculum phage PTm5]